MQSLMAWLTWPRMMFCGGCIYSIAATLAPLLWVAIALLTGFVLYGTGMIVSKVVVLSILIAAAYPVALFAVTAVTAGIGSLSILLYYSIREQIEKRRLRKQHKSKTT